jgi:hypothetical protein
VFAIDLKRLDGSISSVYPFDGGFDGPLHGPFDGSIEGSIQGSIEGGQDTPMEGDRYRYWLGTGIFFLWFFLSVDESPFSWPLKMNSNQQPQPGRVKLYNSLDY